MGTAGLVAGSGRPAVDWIRGGPYCRPVRGHDGMPGGRTITVGAQRRSRRGSGGHGECVGIVVEMECPVALVEVVGIHGGKGMVGVGGDRVQVGGGVGRREMGARVVDVEVLSDGEIEVVLIGSREMAVVVTEGGIVGAVLWVVGVVDAVVVEDAVVIGKLIVRERMRESMSLGVVLEVVVRLDMGSSCWARVGGVEVSVEVRLEARWEARLKVHVHAVVHGGLSIGQARRAERLVGGLETHAASIDALALAWVLMVWV